MPRAHTTHVLATVSSRSSAAQSSNGKLLVTTTKIISVCFDTASDVSALYSSHFQIVGFSSRKKNLFFLARSLAIIVLLNHYSPLLLPFFSALVSRLARCWLLAYTLTHW